MSDSIIEQLKRLAEAQKECDRENDDGSLLAEVLGAYGNGSRIMRVVNTFFIEFDFPALLAHMQAQQAVVDAARELRRLGPSPGGSLCASIAAAEAAIAALDAALNNLKPEHNDEKQ